MLVSATRLYTEEYFVNEMSSVGIPEMQRSKLVSCVIQVPFFLVSVMYSCFLSTKLLLLLLSYYWPNNLQIPRIDFSR
jgi:HrpA-like RNA helicase